MSERILSGLKQRLWFLQLHFQHLIILFNFEVFAETLMVFGRYEIFDTQNKMPEGFLPLDHLRRSAVTTGITYYPDPDVAFKMDFVKERNKSSVVNAPWRVNFGVGWWF